MARYGLHLADLQNAGCFPAGAFIAKASARPPCFRESVWTGAIHPICASSTNRIEALVPPHRSAPEKSMLTSTRSIAGQEDPLASMQRPEGAALI